LGVGVCGLGARLGRSAGAGGVAIEVAGGHPWPASVNRSGALGLRAEFRRSCDSDGVLSRRDNSAMRRNIALLLLAGTSVVLLGGASSVLVAGATAPVASQTLIVPVEPYRILDTRSAIGVPGTSPVGSGQTLVVQIAGVGPVPADAIGVVLNITGTEATQRT
jgi:hypothetical protein